MVVLLFFGGKSCEHDISVITAQQALSAMPKKYTVVPVYMDREGRFKTANCTRLSRFAEGKVKTRECYLQPSSKQLTIKGIVDRHINVHCALICNHGLGGEDGTLQGYLELAGVPYTSCGVMASSTGMDKIIMKKIFVAFGVPCVKFVYCNATTYSEDKERFIKEAERLEYPLVVKPSNLGSSIGISVATNRAELEQAIEVALCYDSRVLVEKAVDNLQEINCSAVRRGNEVLASPLEEPISWHSMLTFEDKYLNGGKGNKMEGMAGLNRRLPAQVLPQQQDKIISLTKKIYSVFDCKGVVRIDFLVDKDSEKVYANEINTIPGALSYYLWEFGGIAFGELCEILIDEAVKERASKDALKYSYESGIVKTK